MLQRSKKDVTEVEYKVTYTTGLINKVSDIMSKLDLGIARIDAPKTSIISFNTTTKVDSKYLANIKKRIIEALEADGDTLISIKRIKP